MREYELMIIMHPELDAAGITSTVEALKAKISSYGELTACDLLGRRRMAYEVRRCNQGTFALLNFTVGGEAVAEIKRFMKVDLHETIIRDLLIKDEKRGMRPPPQPLPGEEGDEDEDELTEEERLARAAAERAALEVAAGDAPVETAAAAPAEAAAAPAEAPAETVAEAPAEAPAEDAPAKAAEES